jgi:hypothetical protein
MAQKDPTHMMIKKMYKIATTSQREREDSSKANLINEVIYEEQNMSEDQDAANIRAFGKQQFMRGASPNNMVPMFPRATATSSVKIEGISKYQ